MTLEEIRKEYNKLDHEIFNLAIEKGGSLTWEEYLEVGGDMIRDLTEEWNKLSSDVTIDEANRQELREIKITNLNNK